MRKSNFELLRLLTIFSIVIGHCLRQSGLIETTSGDNHVIACLAGSFLRIGVNVFLLIGCWFMIDAPFTWKRPFRLYVQTALYTIPLTLVMIGLGEAGSLRNIIQGLVPFFGRAVWFVSAYISLMVLTPYLRPILDIERRKLRQLLVTLFVLLSVVSTIPSSVQVDYMSDFLWFPYVYLLTGYVKHNSLLSRLPGKWLCLLSGLSIYLVLAGAKALDIGGPLPENYLTNIRSIPNFLCALLIFAAFAKSDIGSVRLINFLASPTLAIYVIHQTPAFIDFQWQKVFPCADWATLPPASFCLILLVPPCVLLTVTLLTETIRHRWNFCVKRWFRAMR